MSRRGRKQKAEQEESEKSASEALTSPAEVVDIIFPVSRLGTRVLLIGQPGTGKTSLTKWLLGAHNFDSVIVFSGAGSDDEYAGLENVKTIGGFDPSLLAKIIMFQQKTAPADRRRILVCFDDMIGEIGSSGPNAEILSKTAALARKLNVSLLFTMQSLKMLNKTVRLSADSVIITRITTEETVAASKFTVGCSARALDSIIKTYGRLGIAFGFFAADAYSGGVSLIEFTR